MFSRLRTSRVLEGLYGVAKDDEWVAQASGIGDMHAELTKHLMAVQCEGSRPGQTSIECLLVLVHYRFCAPLTLSQTMP